jgi:hypothetical protein
MSNVSKVLKFAALYPNHLNLNGDHANLLVLKKRLEWRGVKAEIVEVVRPVDLHSFDLVLLGHGSAAAWAEIGIIDPNLVAKIARLVESNFPVLAVSSGYVNLIEELDSNATEHGEHISKFARVDETVGYVNSDSQVAEIIWRGNSLLTLLHGPVLAKNPKLADEIISKANWCDTSLTSIDIETVDLLAEASREIAFRD